MSVKEEMEDINLHELQKKILKRIGYTGRKSFSEVRGDAESNKVAFHLKKLREKGLIQKEGDRYVITPQGREILPYFDLENLRHPVTVVDLLVFHEGEVYLKPKEEDPLDPFSGQYRTPSSRIGQNERLTDKAADIFADEFDGDSHIRPAGAFDSQVTFADGSNQHYLLFFFSAFVEEKRKGDWFSLDELDDIAVLPGLASVIRHIYDQDERFIGTWDVVEDDSGSFSVDDLEF